MKTLEMSAHQRIGIVATLLALLAVACDPIVMIPGGELSGDVVPIPESWAFTDEFDTVQLETRPADPYSVNIWAVAAGDAIYIASGSGAEAKWSQNIAEDHRVRLRVDDSIYELVATEANDDVSRTLFIEAAKKKYDFDPDEADASKAILYRLDARPAQ